MRFGALPASVLRAEAANARARALVLLRSVDGQVGPAGPAVILSSAGLFLVSMVVKRS